MRVGIGYDIHRLVKGRPMILGGVSIPHTKGPEGHSDGDVLLHAVCDAVLGALAKEDIGTRFPDTDPKHKDASSMEFLKSVAGLMREEGFKSSNLDCIVIMEEPKIGPYREEMIRLTGGVLGLSPERINIKGKTSEGMGLIGEGKAVAAYAAVLLEEDKK